jgi:uncharacterized protein (DUF433 family)
MDAALGKIEWVTRGALREDKRVITRTGSIIDNGRGPQLSTCRITVQDLLPYYREGASNDEIRRWIPALSDEEIKVLENYIQEHLPEVLQKETEIKARHEELKASQPKWTRASESLSIAERQARLREALARRKGEQNSADSSLG